MKRGPTQELEQAQSKHQKMSPDLSDIGYELSISDFEWDEANSYFQSLPRNVTNCKLDKKQHAKPLLHSFVRLDNGSIVALANRKREGILGEGSFGVVVKGQYESGENCAIKVEAGRRRNPHRNKNILLMKKIGYHLGEADRRLPFQREFKGQLTDSKRYTALALRPGKELAKQLCELSMVQKLLVAIKCCEAVLALHAERIIHVDIKPENFIAAVHNDDIILNTCDYDFSMTLPENKTSIKSTDWAGTKEYLPPEISSELEISTYSFSSDIFSLGIMFGKDLALPESIYKNMLNTNPDHRTTLEATILKLNTELAKYKDNDFEMESQENSTFFNKLSSCTIC